MMNYIKSLESVMAFEEKIERMNIAFDFSRDYTVVKVPEDWSNADDFAINMVYWLRPYVADKLHIDYQKVILVAISKNNKVVVLCENDRYRNYLWEYFHQPSFGSAQLYDNVNPELILEKLDSYFARV